MGAVFHAGNGSIITKSMKVIWAIFMIGAGIAYPPLFAVYAAIIGFYLWNA